MGKHDFSPFHAILRLFVLGPSAGWPCGHVRVIIVEDPRGGGQPASQGGQLPVGGGVLLARGSRRLLVGSWTPFLG